MSLSIIKKFDEDIRKSQKASEKCIKELQNLEKCNNENKDCTDLFNLWIKCNNTPTIQNKNQNLERKDN